MDNLRKYLIASAWTSMLTFSRHRSSFSFQSEFGLEREKGEGCECQSHVETRKCPRPTPLSVPSLRSAFVKCWQTAQHRENKHRSTISHPRFNYLIESDGTLVVRPRSFSARSPSRAFRTAIPLQMRVTSNKSFRTSGEQFLSLSLSPSPPLFLCLSFMCRPITVKDPHLLCSGA